MFPQIIVLSLSLALFASTGGCTGTLEEEISEKTEALQKSPLLLPRIMSPDEDEESQEDTKVGPKILSGNKRPPYRPPFQQIGTEHRPQQVPPPPPSKIQSGQSSDDELQLLFSALEKLIKRLEKMEVRLSTLENVVLFLANKKPGDVDAPNKCPEKFSRIDGIRDRCFYISSLDKSYRQQGINWKSAAGQCEKLGGRLIELPSHPDFHRLSQFMVKHTDTRISNKTDYWTGGLNPGLIWLWSASGSQIDEDKRFWNENEYTKAPGCLKLSYSNRLDAFYFKGAPCQQQQNFICEINA